MCPVKLPQVQQRDKAIYRSVGYGPTFGANTGTNKRDLMVADCANANSNSNTNLGMTYQLPEGCHHAGGHSFFTGSGCFEGGGHFWVAEVEVMGVGNGS